MAQTIIKKIILENGQKVYEATCPADPTIKPRRPQPEEKQNEVDNLFSIDTVEDSSEEDEG